MKRFFTLIIVFLLSFKLLTAQEKFIEHTIVKGETVYAISKKYGVTIGAIYKLNPDSNNIIYPGEILRIPDINNTSTSENKTSTNNSDFIDYEVKRGDTKFGLSKRFGVSIASLETQNPQIINMLQTGHILRIDKTLKPEAKSLNTNGHIVTKGETLWGISKQYSVNLNALINANSNVLSEFLQIGQNLIIPDINTVNKTSQDQKHIVKRGETKYSLAKQFNMTIAELEAKNPQIVPMLMAGHKLDVNSTLSPNESNEVVTSSTEKQDVEINKIDNSEAEEKVVETVDSEKDSNTVMKESASPYVDYIIQPQETLYSLSKKANMTIGELYNLNPKLLTGVKKGDIIKMPIAPKKKIIITNTDTTNLSKTAVANVSKSLVTSIDFSEKNGLYFYLPFSERDFNSERFRQKSENENLQKYFEFYEGAQMAIDSAKALNLNFDVTLVEQKEDRQSRQEIIVDDVNNENTIVIPFLRKNTKYPEIISSIKVPVIDIKSNLTAYPNATIYNSIPSDEFQKIKILNYLANKANVNIIVVSNLEEAPNKKLISDKLPNAKFLKVDKAGFFDENQLRATLKTDQLNYVILDSQQTIVFLNSTTALMGQLSEYKIQLVLINSALLNKQNEASKMRYKILKLIYPSLALKQNLTDFKDFERKYELRYTTKPTLNALIGFDVTLDVILRLAQGASFESSIITILNTEQTKLQFNYQKTNSAFYSNEAVYLMQYDPTDGAIRIQ